MLENLTSSHQPRSQLANLRKGPLGTVTSCSPLVDLTSFFKTSCPTKHTSRSHTHTPLETRLPPSARHGCLSSKLGLLQAATEGGVLSES